MGQKPDSARNFEASNGGVMELKTTADRREYLYAQAWVDEPASGMDVINLLSDLTTVLARVEELEKQIAASQRHRCRCDDAMKPYEVFNGWKMAAKRWNKDQGNENT